MSRFLALLASAMLAAPVLAQTPGSCEVGSARSYLDVSDTRVELTTTGALFGDAGYIVPRASGAFPVYTARLWMSGIVDAEIRAFWSTWGRPSLWPGPLNDGATLPNAEDCSAYDRVWTVSTYDIAVYEQTGAATSDLLDWPVGLGAPTVDANGAPVTPRSREQSLDLDAGERPALSGTQTAFWIMNDVGNQNVAYLGNGEYRPVSPLGVEVTVTAFSIASDVDALNQTTVYRFRITNRNTRPIEDAHLGIVAVPAANGSHGNLVGVDTTRHLAFGYSGSDHPQDYEVPPAIGIDLFGGLSAHTTIADHGPSPINLPPSPEAIHARLQGLWNDGTPILEDGFGYAPYGANGPAIRVAFPGDPVTESFWSMETSFAEGGTNVSPSDWYTIPSSPRFTLRPGESTDFEVAVLFAQAPNRLDAVTELRAVSDLVQAAYDDGSLFQTTEAPPLLEAPVLLAPSEASTFIEESVTLSWAPVPDATLYRVEQSTSPSFDDGFVRHMDSTSTWGWLGINDTTTYYWRVRAESPTRRGPFSDVRSYTSYVYRYFRDVLRLQDGSPAFVEAVGPDGSDPCAEGVTSPDGCDEVDGNLVYNSLNSTGTYYVGAANGLADSQVNLQQFAPNDFEIRFTDTGGLGYYIFQEDEIIRVPFEIWDIGMVAPGDVNDPSDDVRLIPALFADNGGTCAFNADEIPDGQTTISGYVESDRIYAYYPTTTYDDFEAAFGPLVASAPESCYLASAESAESHIDLNRYRPIQRQVFGSSSDTPTLPATGTVIRFYTTDPRPVTDEATPRADELTLGAPYPNPTASSLTVPYTLASSSAVEVAIYDVLGRRVLELVNARQPEGAHTATLDARTLAPGVYVVRLRAGEEVRTTRITVVR